MRPPLVRFLLMKSLRSISRYSCRKCRRAECKQCTARRHHSCLSSKEPSKTVTFPGTSCPPSAGITSSLGCPPMNAVHDNGLRLTRRHHPELICHHGNLGKGEEKLLIDPDNNAPIITTILAIILTFLTIIVSVTITVQKYTLDTSQNLQCSASRSSWLTSTTPPCHTSSTST